MSRRFRNISGPGIRRRRMARKLSQEQLAAKLQLAGLHHLDRVAVAKIESRIRSVFDWELSVIAGVLGTSAEEIAADAGAWRDQDLPDLIRGRKDE